MEVPRHWRLQKQRYGLVGEVCPHCDARIFPARDICPECGGDLEWNAARQALVCPYCGTIAPWSEAQADDPGGSGIIENDLVQALAARDVPALGKQTVDVVNRFLLPRVVEQTLLVRTEPLQSLKCPSSKLQYRYSVSHLLIPTPCVWVAHANAPGAGTARRMRDIISL